MLSLDRCPLLFLFSVLSSDLSLINLLRRVVQKVKPTMYTGPDKVS